MQKRNRWRRKHRNWWWWFIILKSTGFSAHQYKRLNSWGTAAEGCWDTKGISAMLRGWQEGGLFSLGRAGEDLATTCHPKRPQKPHSSVKGQEEGLKLQQGHLSWTKGRKFSQVEGLCNRAQLCTALSNCIWPCTWSQPSLREQGWWPPELPAKPSSPGTHTLHIRCQMPLTLQSPLAFQMHVTFSHQF